MRAAIYARVSTQDQNMDAQFREVRLWAERAGHEVVIEYSETVSGASKKRPQFDAMMKAATLREFDVVAVWSMDRLGRNLAQIAKTMNELAGLKIEIFALKQGMDTSTPTGRAMLGMCAVFGELELELNKERTHVGIATAKKNGVVFGRPKKGSPRDPNRASEKRVHNGIKSMLQEGIGVNVIAKRLNIGSRRVRRVRDEFGL